MNEDVCFIEAIKQGNLDLIRSIPKSDLHNHFVLGGSRKYILSKTGYDIEPITNPLDSMSEMDSWSARYIETVLTALKGENSWSKQPLNRRKETG